MCNQQLIYVYAVAHGQQMCFTQRRKIKSGPASFFQSQGLFFFSYTRVFTSPFQADSETGTAAGDMSVANTVPEQMEQRGSVWQITLLMVGLLSHVLCMPSLPRRSVSLPATEILDVARQPVRLVPVIYIPGFQSDLQKH